MDDPNVKACLDTGHANVTKENVYDCIVTLGKDLETLHVHDDIACQDRHLIPFQREIDWYGFMKGLKDIGFDGCILFETAIAREIPEPICGQMQKGLADLAKWFVQQVEGK